MRNSSAVTVYLCRVMPHRVKSNNKTSQSTAGNLRRSIVPRKMIHDHHPTLASPAETCTARALPSENFPRCNFRCQGLRHRKPQKGNPDSQSSMQRLNASAIVITVDEGTRFFFLSALLLLFAYSRLSPVYKILVKIVAKSGSHVKP